MVAKRKGIKIEATTGGIQNKESLMNAIKRHSTIEIEEEYFRVSTHVEDSCIKGFIIKLAIENKDDHKVVLYASSISALISSLEEVKKKLDQDVRVGEKVEK